MPEIIGVGLLLFLDGKLLVVRELKSKPQYHKYAGMLSFPLETFEKDDITLENTLHRLAREELGIINGEIALQSIVPDKLSLIPGRSDIATYYGVANFKGNVEHIFIPQDDDIEIVGWLSPEELLTRDSIRVEVNPIIKDFFSRSKG